MLMMRASLFVFQVLCFGLAASADGLESPIQLLQKARDMAATARAEERQEAERADLLIDVARAFVALGDLEQANKTAETLRVNDFWHKSAIAAVAVARARRGDFVGAFATLTLSHAGPAVLARREIAKLQAQRGQIPDAIKTCDTVIAINPRRASQFLVEVATVAERLKDREGARLALGRARELLLANAPTLEALDELSALEELAVAYARLGDDAVAKSLFARAERRAAETDESKNDSADFIAMSLADAGYFDEAFQMASRVDPAQGDFLTGAPRVEYVHAQIGVAAARARRWNEARRATDRLQRSGFKAWVSAAAARAYWEAGQQREAKDAFRSAMQWIVALQPDETAPESASVGAELAHAELAHDAITGAVVVAERIPKTGARDELLRTIVERQVALGDIEGALQTAGKISTMRHVLAEDHRSRALQSIVAAEAKFGKKVVFERLMIAERDALVRARLMTGRAVGLARASDNQN